MSELRNETLLCRASVPVAVFAGVHDTDATDNIINPGITFVSTRQYVSNDVTLIHIDGPAREKDVVPCGYWCPANVIKSMPSTISEPINMNGLENISPVSTKLTIKALPVVIGKTPNSRFIIGNDLDVGSVLDVDRRAMLGNKLYYHIVGSNVNDSAINDAWVQYDNTKMSLPRMILRSLGSGVSATVSDAASAIASVSRSAAGAKVGLPNGDIITLPPTLSSAVKNLSSSTVGTMLASAANGLKSLWTRSSNSSTSVGNTLMNVPIGRLLFVHGMPFQFTGITDRREYASERYGRSKNAEIDCKVNATSYRQPDLYGRTFAREVAANVPICTITPGRPYFMQPEKKSVLASVKNIFKSGAKMFLPVIAATENTVGEAMEALQDNNGSYDYYGLRVDMQEYYSDINTLSRFSARLLGIENVKYWGEDLVKFDWSRYNHAVDQDYGTIENILGLDAGVAFAYDPEGSVSDQMSNSTTESQFASMFNQLSSASRELDFITGSVTGHELFGSNSGDYQAKAESMLDSSGTVAADVKNSVKRITNWLTNSAHGMNIRFPEIWSESSNARSYSIDMHFVTPYATAFCIWRYVIMPFFHIFAMVAPHSDANASQYSAPYIIRAFSKGYFNVELGIIESMTWKRFGEGDMFSNNGLPLQIDVSISFKDLYHALSITTMMKNGDVFPNNVANFMNNTGLMDLVGTLSGVNMNRISWDKRVSLMMTTTMDAWGSLGGSYKLFWQGRSANILRAMGINSF